MSLDRIDPDLLKQIPNLPIEEQKEILSLLEELEKAAKDVTKWMKDKIKAIFKWISNKFKKKTDKELIKELGRFFFRNFIDI